MRHAARIPGPNHSIDLHWRGSGWRDLEAELDARWGSLERGRRLLHDYAGGRGEGGGAGVGLESGRLTSGLVLLHLRTSYGE